MGSLTPPIDELCLEYQETSYFDDFVDPTLQDYDFLDLGFLDLDFPVMTARLAGPQLSEEDSGDEAGGGGAASPELGLDKYDVLSNGKEPSPPKLPTLELALESMPEEPTHSVLMTPPPSASRPTVVAKPLPLVPVVDVDAEMVAFEALQPDMSETTVDVIVKWLHPVLIDGMYLPADKVIKDYHKKHPSAEADIVRATGYPCDQIMSLLCRSRKQPADRKRVMDKSKGAVKKKGGVASSKPPVIARDAIERTMKGQWWLGVQLERWREDKVKMAAMYQRSLINFASMSGLTEGNALINCCGSAKIGCEGSIYRRAVGIKPEPAPRATRRSPSPPAAPLGVNRRRGAKAAKTSGSSCHRRQQHKPRLSRSGKCAIR
eukprot:CAMPEP_0182926004 /NCGR_PEP_ID=MMETSP0105_2-20130417/10775_1 /TAXON_ID=81532 ORGANISM="Acanthoeca-like sp., Strain 10tr" /NCGR_SAMPLE_ID=MMETSP0105_2 /ASSEMBLY_ACC=CAM_ASM_000205 /LENGTH=375 /DNA_ID=CAMNT_0025063875 /DNA_START=95 /DNA_END=1222 /DNA_ORIENTATION=-